MFQRLATMLQVSNTCKMNDINSILFFSYLIIKLKNDSNESLFFTIALKSYIILKVSFS
jgi:hypothetical protein